VVVILPATEAARRTTRDYACILSRQAVSVSSSLAYRCVTQQNGRPTGEGPQSAAIHRGCCGQRSVPWSMKKSERPQLHLQVPHPRHCAYSRAVQRALQTISSPINLDIVHTRALFNAPFRLYLPLLTSTSAIAPTHNSPTHNLTDNPKHRCLHRRFTVLLLSIVTSE
jgi:hypothetical protein